MQIKPVWPWIRLFTSQCFSVTIWDENPLTHILGELLILMNVMAPTRLEVLICQVLEEKAILKYLSDCLITSLGAMLSPFLPIQETVFLVEK